MSPGVAEISLQWYKILVPWEDSLIEVDSQWEESTWPHCYPDRTHSTQYISRH